MWPSSSTMTTPNSSGFSTLLRAMVTTASRSRWKSMTAERSKSHRASPLMTRNVSSSSPSAFLTEPAVPSGVSSTAYSICMPNDDPSPK